MGRDVIAAGGGERVEVCVSFWEDPRIGLRGIFPVGLASGLFDCARFA